MGLFNAIFGKRSPAADSGTLFQTLTAYSPVFTSWGGQIYESELVRASIHARASRVSKLSVSIQGSANPTLQNKLRHSPNEWQTWPAFLYRLSTILDVHNTAFIIPVTDYDGNTTGIFPVLPTLCQLVEYGGDVWLRYQFRTGQFAAVEFDRCAIMTKFQYSDDLFGENNAALTPTMNLIHIRNQGITEAVKNSATFRFMAVNNNWANSKDLAKEKDRFTRDNIQNSEGPVILFPSSYKDIRQIISKPYVVDSNEAAEIRTSVYNYFGTNEKILQNSATGDELSAFDDGVTEVFANNFDAALTMMLFTPTQRSFGNKVVSAIDRIHYMTFSQKIEFATSMADRGGLNIDEVREIFGKPPLPNGQGQAYTIRGEYYLMNPDGTVTKKGEELNSGTQTE